MTYPHPPWLGEHGNKLERGLRTLPIFVSSALRASGSRSHWTAWLHHQDGVPALDSALDGLYWGANVVWLPDRTETAAPFFAAIAGLAPQYDQAAYVTLTRSPDEVRAALPASA